MEKIGKYWLIKKLGGRNAGVSALSAATLIAVPAEALPRAPVACRHGFDRAFLRILAGRLTLANARLASV